MDLSLAAPPFFISHYSLFPSSRAGYSRIIILTSALMEICCSLANFFIDSTCVSVRQQAQHCPYVPYLWESTRLGWL